MPPPAAAPKKATNITLSADVLSEAKTLGINLSQACDQFLRELLRNERERRWQADNAEFIATYNRSVESEGLPLEEWRGFEMPRFDVYPNSGSHAESVPYLLAVQSDLLQGLATRVVVPLRRSDLFPADRLTPIFEIKGIVCLMKTPNITRPRPTDTPPPLQ